MSGFWGNSMPAGNGSLHGVFTCKGISSLEHQMNEPFACVCHFLLRRRAVALRYIPLVA